jgi:PAS domain S-box-containing protein
MNAVDGMETLKPTIRVLLVEDSAGDALLIRKHLEKAEKSDLLGRVETEHVTTLSDAVEICESQTGFHVILLDLGLSESHGLDTLSRMRDAEGGTPIVVLTGLSDEGLAHNAVAAGADDFLHKDGLTPDTLLRTLRYAIDRAERGRELRLKTDAIDFADLAMFLEDVSADGSREVYVNRAFTELTGYSADEMAQKTIVEMLDGEKLEGEFDSIEAAIASGENVRFETMLQTAGGERFWVSVGVVPVKHRRERTSQTLYTLEDVSARHEMLTRLAELDRMITLGTLSAAVAHEINNPLSFIGGNVQYALKRLQKVRSAHPDVADDLEEVTEALEDALDGSRRVRDVVEDLRDLAGGGVPDADTMTQRVDVANAVETSMSMIRKQVEYRAVLHVDIDPDVPDVVGNASKLGQVVLNLTLNAAQAMSGSSKGRVDVRVRHSDETVLIEVEDDGEGIPAENLESIFEPFFSTKSSQKGTGLGLAICKQTVTRMGGEIDVESEPGVGTLFSVRLPTAGRRLREWSQISEISEVDEE